MPTATNPVSILREGQQVSGELLAARRRTRVIDALAKLTFQKGYQPTTVGCIVSEAGIARNTFYETFGGKDDAAAAMVASALPSDEPLFPSGHPGLDLFLIDVATAKRLGVVAPGDLLRPLEHLAGETPPSSDDSLLRTLPPGRHGLEQKFVTDNQRQRLLVGFAAAVSTKGFPGVTIADVTDEGHVSRRTFYEHFNDIGDLASSLLRSVAPFLPVISVATGEGALAVEVAALWFTGQGGAARDLLGAAQEVAGGSIARAA